MALIPTWPIAAACLVAGAMLGAGADHLYMNGKVNRLTATLNTERTAHAEQLRVREVQRATDERAARKTEQQMAEVIGVIEQENQYALDRTRTDADALIARLREQAAAKPTGASPVPGAATTCENPVGGVVLAGSREDIVRLAERAARQQAELAKCYAAYDSVGR